VLEWKGGEGRGPLSLELSPTWACNVNCRFCRRKDELKDYYRRERDLTDAQWVGIVERALALGTRKFMLRGGGDPLLRRSLLHELLPLVAANPEAEFSILTNGTLIDERLADGLTAAGWGEVTISLHGGTAATHDYVTDQPGSFAAVERSLANLAAARRAGGKPRVTFHCVVTRRSCRELAPLIELAARRGVEHVGFFPMHNPPYPEHVTELTMRPEDEKDFAALVPGYIALCERLKVGHCVQMSYQGENKELSAQSTGELKMPSVSAEEAVGLKPSCFFPFHHATITASGAMAPCCYGENAQRKADLHDVSFDAAWLGGDMGEYRASFEKGKLADFCKQCPNWYQRDNARVGALLAEAAT
jgi:MoaA/NifB/PqqE/SkfB family radical SAM enzyme